MAFKWYFIRCQSGREKRIRDNALHRLKIGGRRRRHPPGRHAVQDRDGPEAGARSAPWRRSSTPGHLMVQADLENPEDAQVIKARTILRIDGLRDFLGAPGEPTSIPEAEVTDILSMMTPESRPQVTIGLSKGEQVKINTGPFDGFDGTVDEVNPEKGTVRVVVTIKADRPSTWYSEVDSVWKMPPQGPREKGTAPTFKQTDRCPGPRGGTPSSALFAASSGSRILPTTMAKELTGKIKLQCPAGQATPAPPSDRR